MSKTTKSETENKPPEWATPLFTQSATEAQNLYNSGSGGNTYQGSTVAPLSGTTISGINQLAQAGANWNTSGSRPLFQQIGTAAASNPFTNYLTNAAASAGRPSYSEQNLAGIAAGQDNPYFEQALKGQLDKTAAQVQSQFSGAGRYGSGANTGALADSLGNIRSTALSNQWNTNIQNQLAANGQMDSARLQGQTLQGNLLSNAGNLYSTGVGQAQNAAQSIANLDQQQFTNRLAGANATVQAGNMLDTQNQQQLADQIAQWYANDNQDWTRLGLLQAAAAGSAGNYGTQTQIARQPIGIGGILSGLGGLKSSDARLKDNIVPVGYRNGHVVWEFTYKGSVERFRGVMAQFVLDMQPEAVVTGADGFYAVDYDMVGFPMERIH